MKKRLFIMVAVLLMALAFASCGDKQKEMKAGDDSKLNEVTENNEVEAADVEVEETTAAETEVAETEPSGQAEAGAVALSENYVEKQVPKFAINGKVYTIGETSLQELIDDGVEFANPDHLENREMVPREEATGIVIVTGDYDKVELSAYNYEETAISVTECVLNRVVAEGHIEGAEEVLKFSFPADLTLEMLTEKEGDDYDYGYYEVDGVKIDTYGYYGFSDEYFYDFAFKEGKYYGVTIRYKRS